MSEELQFDLKWNQHDWSVVHSIAGMVGNNEYTDCVVMAEGLKLRLHRIILAWASDYFKEALSVRPEGNAEPTIVCNELKYKDLYNVIKFVYTGALTLSHTDTVSFLQAGNILRVKGMTNMAMVIKGEETRVKKEEAPPPGNDEYTIHGRKRQYAYVSDSDDDKEVPAKRTRGERKKAGTYKVEEELEEEKPKVPSTRGRKRTQLPKGMKVKEEEEEYAPFKCVHCRRGYNTKSTINNHERFCELNPNRKISKCPICDANVPSGSITWHKKTKHGYVPNANKRQGKAQKAPATTRGFDN